MARIIPGMYVTGSFTASAPFNTVCDPTVNYTVEALRTVDELRTAGLDLNALIYEPAGMSEVDGEIMLDQLDQAAGVVIILTAFDKTSIYLPSSHLVSFPSADGTTYNHIAMIVDIGAVPPNMENVLAETQVEIQDLVLNKVGVDAIVSLGVIPTATVIGAGQARAFENTRQNKIKNTPTNAANVANLEAKVLKQEVYIAKLEANLAAALARINQA